MCWWNTCEPHRRVRDTPHLLDSRLVRCYILGQRQEPFPGPEHLNCPMAAGAPNPSLTSREIFTAWGRILTGRVPLLSIEITRECPLSCPGCYAYGDTHLGNGTRLTDVSDFRGDDLVNGILGLVERHDPIQVSLVGGEPLIRHRELSRVLPVLSRRGGTDTLIVTSAVIPIPKE